MRLFSSAVPLFGAGVMLPRAKRGAFCGNASPLQAADGAFYLDADPARVNDGAFCFGDAPFCGTRGAVDLTDDALSVTREAFNSSDGAFYPNDDALSSSVPRHPPAAPVAADIAKPPRQLRGGRSAGRAVGSSRHFRLGAACLKSNTTVQRTCRTHSRSTTAGGICFAGAALLVTLYGLVCGYTRL